MRRKKTSRRKEKAQPHTSKSSNLEFRNTEDVLGVRKRKKVSEDVVATTSSVIQEDVLRNEVVLTNIFKYVSLVDLSACQLVCATWRNVSLTTWRSSVTLTFISTWHGRTGIEKRIYLSHRNLSQTSLSEIFSTNQVQKYTDIRRGHNINNAKDERISVTKFLEHWARWGCNDKPFHKFCLDSWWLGLNARVISTPTSTLTRFWRVIGSHVTQLEMTNCSSENSQPFFELINQHCPNLIKLSLTCCSFSGKNSWSQKRLLEAVPVYIAPLHGSHLNLKSLTVNMKDRTSDSELRIPWLELLSNFPSLKSLAIEVRSEGTQFTELKKLLKAIKTIRTHNANQLLLTALKTTYPVAVGRHVFEKGVVKLIEELQIPLQSVRLSNVLGPDGSRMAWNTEELKEIIKRHGEALQVLFAPPGFYQCKNFPYEKKLKNLMEITATDEFCGSLNFLQWTPNLKKLSIYDATIRPLNPRLPANGLYGRVTELVSNTCLSYTINLKLISLTSLSLSNIVVSVDDLQTLTSWMPKLTDLKIFIDDERFSIVCQYWRNMVNLTAVGHSLTDEGLTGLEFVMTGATQNQPPLKLVKNRVETRPNITFLKELQLFDGRNTRITDASVYHGFLKMNIKGKRQLRVLIEDTEISKIGIKALHMKHVKTDYGFFK